MTSNCINKYTALACNTRPCVEGDSNGTNGALNANNDLILQLVSKVTGNVGYGFRNNIPVIMREKICNPDPDMYIMMAFIGILTKNESTMETQIGIGTFSLVQERLPTPF